MPPSLHSVLGASSAHRWLVCTPSARLCELFEKRYGKKESAYAADGTKAHALAELKVRRAIYAADDMSAKKHALMSKAEQRAYPGINNARYRKLRESLGDIPEDMEHATDAYCDIVMEKYLRAREADASTALLLEQRLDYSQWVPSGFGTGDCVIVSDTVLEVIDFKYGQGVQVDAPGNPQLRLYALGAFAAFHVLFDFDRVRTTIVQPRIEHLSEEPLTVAELLNWADEVVVEKAKLAWAGLGEQIPGEHCRWCAAKAVCPARATVGLKVLQAGLEGSPGILSTEQLIGILPYLDDAESWIQDVKDHVELAALSGERIPGYKLVRGKKPNRVWANPEGVEAALLRTGYPTDVFRETRLKPVGAVEKELGKAAFQALLGDLVLQGEGKLILVPESDPRQGYNSAKVAFSDLITSNTTTTD